MTRYRFTLADAHPDLAAPARRLARLLKAAKRAYGFEAGPVLELPDSKSQEIQTAAARLSAVEKALLFVLGSLCGLHERGLVGFRGEGVHAITDEGMVLFQELHASGYRPSSEEIAYAVALFRADPPPGEEENPKSKIPREAAP